MPHLGITSAARFSCNDQNALSPSDQVLKITLRLAAAVEDPHAQQGEQAHPRLRAAPAPRFSGCRTKDDARILVAFDDLRGRWPPGAKSPAPPTRNVYPVPLCHEAGSP